MVFLFHDVPACVAQCSFVPEHVSPERRGFGREVGSSTLMTIAMQAGPHGTSNEERF
jgi:hypothetical protein